MAISIESCEQVSVRELAVVLRLKQGRGTGGALIGFLQRLGSEGIVSGALVSVLPVRPFSFSSSRV